jgi:hypothetical protein
MDSGSFEQVVRDLVHVFHRANDLRANRFSVVEALQFSPRSAVCAFDKLSLDWVVLVNSVRVDPLLDLDTTGAIVESVSGVGGLRRDIADLPNESELAWALAAALKNPDDPAYLGNNSTIDLEGITCSIRLSI